MSSIISLVLEGSTYAGSAAILRDADVVCARELANVPTPGRSGRDELFLPMVAACIEESGIPKDRIDRIVCGAGPGSFTSLRVAASIAKGIAVATGRPLFAVSSLALLVAGVLPATGKYLPTLPAMRGEVFTQLLEARDDEVVELGPPAIISDDAVTGLAKESGAAVIAGVIPHARSAAAIIGSIIAGGPCDIETWEPQYGRLAEAQVRWEAAHGRPLSTAG